MVQVEVARGDKRPKTKKLNKLFVYGIFLSESTRRLYGMSNHHYTIVKDFVTAVKYGSIVEAVRVAPELGIALTGVIVDVDPSHWVEIDTLETGYDRRKVTTNDGQKAWMYMRKEY